MLIDICIPEDNEEDFIRIAGMLGIEKLCFLYEKKTNREVPGYAGSFYKSKAALKNVFCTSFSRKDILAREVGFYVPQTDKKTGRYEILTMAECRLIKENNKTVVVPFSAFLNSADRVQVIRALLQNAKLLMKFKCRIAASSFANSPYDLRSSRELRSFLVFLGFSEEVAKQSINELAMALK